MTANGLWVPHSRRKPRVYQPRYQRDCLEYDKILYLLNPTEENTRIAGKKIDVFDYPDGTLAFKYARRTLTHQAFDKLACVDQGAIVDKKRLGAVLKLAQIHQDEREQYGKS